LGFHFALSGVGQCERKLKYEGKEEERGQKEGRKKGHKHTNKYVCFVDGKLLFVF
jgi:hypothetical protein